MSISNHGRVGKALELLKGGLGPFGEREVKAHFGENWDAEMRDTLSATRPAQEGGKPQAAQAALFADMED